MPLLMEIYYIGAGTIDYHNRIRCKELKLEKRILTKDCRERAIESSIGFSKASIRQKTSDQTLSKFNISAQKCSVCEKISCIILTIEHWIRVLHPRKSLIKLCRRSISRPQSAFLVRKLNA